MEEPQKRVLIDVFGESSDSEDEERQFGNSIYEYSSQNSNEKENPSWIQIKEINGLWLNKHFISPERQRSLLSAIENEGWFIESSHNQAMRFGDLPAWATELSGSIREVCSSNFDCEFGDSVTCEDKKACPLPFPPDLLWREPFFDQLIVNVYQPGEGICSHVDLMRFEDGIAIVSLESACVMHFSKVEAEVHNVEEEEKNDSPTRKIPVYLNPGSLVLMWGEARYLWKHEINRNPGFQVWKGEEIHQRKRTSITLRKLCESI